MKLKNLVASVLAAGGLLVAVSSHAGEARFLPVLESGFTLGPSLAVSLGAMDVQDSDEDAVLAYGIDLSFNCLLFQTPENRMRTHLQVNHTDESDLTSTSFELSPRYNLPLGTEVSLGVGPVLALVVADTGDGNQSLFGYGVVVGPEYRAGRFFAGLDLRYLNTTKDSGVEFENWAALAKFGVNF